MNQSKKTLLTRIHKHLSRSMPQIRLLIGLKELQDLELIDVNISDSRPFSCFEYEIHATNDFTYTNSKKFLEHLGVIEDGNLLGENQATDYKTFMLSYDPDIRIWLRVYKPQTKRL